MAERSSTHAEFVGRLLNVSQFAHAHSNLSAPWRLSSVRRAVFPA